MLSAHILRRSLVLQNGRIGSRGGKEIRVGARATYDGLSREYLSIRQDRLKITEGAWTYSQRPPADYPKQGWKLHVSATIFTATEVLRRVLDFLLQVDVVFKVARNLDVLIQINSGLDFSQVGKFMTIYCRDENQALSLAQKLRGLTQGLEGPEVPFDRRYAGIVYYRFGAFVGSRDAAGSVADRKGALHDDRRLPNRAVPAWLSDPFGGVDSSARLFSRGPIGRDYIVFRALSQRGKGGVYETLDLRATPARLSILKEGRRHGETYWDGSDGAERMKREVLVLRDLGHAGVPVPRVDRFFSQAGHRYVVMERLRGRPLLARGRARVVRPSWRRSQRIVDAVSMLLARIHTAGWVWRDCKPDNLLWDAGELRPVDFEGACRQSDTAALPWGAPQYTPTGIYNSFTRPSGTAEDDFALAVIAYQFGTGELPPKSPESQADRLKETECPTNLRQMILHQLQPW